MLLYYLLFQAKIIRAANTNEVVVIKERSKNGNRRSCVLTKRHIFTIIDESLSSERIPTN